jgi:hypothetical protein
MYSKNLSFVVQGPIIDKDNCTIRCLSSIRKYFPQSEIILSTWPNYDVKNISYDKLVVSYNDPGDHYMNLNRQIITTQRGLEKASNDTSIKIRTDIIFSNDNILQYYGKWNIKNIMPVFDDIIMVSNMQTIDPENNVEMKSWHRCFNPSDWAIMGATSDLGFLFDIPLIDNSVEFTISPEQYIWLHTIQKKYPEIKLKNMTEVNSDLIEKTLIFYACNLTILNIYSQFGIYSEKYKYQNELDNHFMQHQKWLDYREKL